jgi:GAF domain-containing protein
VGDCVASSGSPIVRRMSPFNADATLADVFVLLADTLRPGYDIVDTLDLLVKASTTFTSAAEAGILLVDASGALRVGASSTERTSEVEEAQMGVGGGPCSDAVQSGQEVEVENIADMGDMWPEFVSTARARGFHAAHAFPMQLRAQSLGGLNLFSAHVGSFSDRDAALARGFAQIATIGIIQHQTIGERETVASHLQRALESRIVIEQAKGVIAAQHDITMDYAFTLLRRHARRTSTGLRSIADQVVSRRLTITDSTSPAA